MTIEYYAFALFLTGLICLIALTCKALFANVRQQNKLINEKEAKLLQLYQTIESIMEEFNDQVKAVTEEISEYENRAAFVAAPSIKQAAKQLDVSHALDASQDNYAAASRTRRIDASRPNVTNAYKAQAKAERRAKSDAHYGPAVFTKDDESSMFRRLFDETVVQTSPTYIETLEQQPVTQLPPSSVETSDKISRSEMILALADEGKTDAQIASELGITQNEVKLVVGLRVRG